MNYDLLYFIIADGEVGNDEETNKSSSCILIYTIPKQYKEMKIT